MFSFLFFSLLIWLHKIMNGRTLKIHYHMSRTLKCIDLGVFCFIFGKLGKILKCPDLWMYAWLMFQYSRLWQQEKYGPVGLVHIDAHSDTNDSMLGEKIAHGTPFRRAMEEGCLVGNKVIQIGLRGSNYHLEDYEWAKTQVVDLQSNMILISLSHCWDITISKLSLLWKL